MTAENIYNHLDRNNLPLKYGDKVFLKSCWSKMYLHEVVGFTKQYVICICGDTVRYRKPSNVVQVMNANNWKYYV